MSERISVPLYYLLDEPEDKSRLGLWASHVGDFDEVIGYTALGNFFLRNPSTCEYAVFYPQRPGNNAKIYGPFDSTLEFRREVLEDEGFVEYCLKPADVSVLVSELGTLGAAEVYFPVPFQGLGGSGELSTFNKGDVWVHIDLLGQSAL